MKKVLSVLGVILLIASIVGCVFLFLQREKIIADRDAVLSQNSKLQQSIDAIGPLTTVWTVKTKVGPGDEVKRDNLVELTVPVSNTSENTIITIDDICGENIKPLDKYYYKVTVQPNTMITKDLVMQDFMISPVYERDLVLPFKPIGLKVGDYIDINVTLPGGELMRAMTHKRVYMILDNVVKVKLSMGEKYVYETLLTDHQYFGNVGLKVWADKYIEPGLSEGNEPLPMYPVSNYSATLMNRDPEIENKTDYINTELRNYIEQVLLFYADAADGTVFPSLPTSPHEAIEAGVLNAAQQLYIDTFYGEEGEPLSKTTDLAGTGGDGSLTGEEDGRTSTGNVLGDLNQSTGDAYGDLNAAADQLGNMTQETTAETASETKSPETMGNVDSEGNRSNIDQQNKNDSKTSGNIFSDADDLD